MKESREGLVEGEAVDIPAGGRSGGRRNENGRNKVHRSNGTQ